MTLVSTEDALAEQPALGWLCGKGNDRSRLLWERVHGPDLAPDARAAERRLWSDVVLLDRLLAAVARINPQLPAEAVKSACDVALTTVSPSVIEDHRNFHDLLLAGVPVSYPDADGVERNEHAWLVDFENPANNDF